jgi:hypothetical protein
MLLIIGYLWDCFSGKDRVIWLDISVRINLLRQVGLYSVGEIQRVLEGSEAFLLSCVHASTVS